jgi:hypothetical protein
MKDARSTSVNETGSGIECQPLIEACTLELFQNNIFRVTGLPVDATSKEVARQVQKLQMLEEMGGDGVGTQAAFPPVPPPTTDQIRSALARMKEPEHRLVDEFFWYWPETFGKSADDEAIQALLKGDGQKAVDIWVERENYSTSKVATHNLAVMFHMYAVDWTNHHLAHGIDSERATKIRGYWSEALQRWEELAECDEIWDIMKERVRSLDDEALTTGFVRRMRRLLPQALDRVNAEAALKLAEKGEMDWATHHVELMRETHQGLDDVEATAELVLAPIRRRVHQEIQFLQSEVDRSVFTYTDAGTNLMKRCRGWMGIYDLFHGSESHQRMELFDEVAESILRLGSKYLKKSTDHSGVISILSEALDFASSTRIFEEIVEAISVVSEGVDFEKVKPIFDKLNAVDESDGSPKTKLLLIKAQIMHLVNGACGELGEESQTFQQLADALAIALRSISIEAHNKHTDYDTASEAIELALGFARSSELRTRLQEDQKALRNSKANYKCMVCGVRQADPNHSRFLDLTELNALGAFDALPPKQTMDVVGQGGIRVARCAECAAKQDRSIVRSKGKGKGSGGGCLLLALLIGLGLITIWNLSQS